MATRALTSRQLPDYWDDTQKWGGRLLRFVLEFAGAFVLSEVFQSLTDSALWLPRDWRLGLMFIVSFTAATLSEFAAFLMTVIAPAKAHATHGHPGHRPWWWRTTRLAITLLFLAIASISMWEMYSLREQCVRSLTPPVGWWQKQFGSDPHVGLAREKTLGAASEAPAASAASYATSPPTAEATAARDAAGPLVTPDFLNPQRGTIYIPEHFDRDMERYLTHAGDGNLEDGIRATLDQEPMLIVDWVRGRGAANLRDTTRHFLRLLFITVFAIAVAWGVGRPHFGELLPDIISHFSGG